jgi:hypothetical protein
MPLGIGKLPPPRAMKGPYPNGVVMDTEKLMFFSLSLSVMESVLPERLAVTDSGGGRGFSQLVRLDRLPEEVRWQVHSSLGICERNTSGACRSYDRSPVPTVWRRFGSMK